MQGRGLVRKVQQDSLRRTGLLPGLEIVQIDGLSAVEYANCYVRPYQSGSIMQNVDVQTYTHNLLRGPRTKPVTPTSRDAQGRQFARVLSRRGYGKYLPYVRTQLRFLPGNVAYLQVNWFETDAGFKRFVAAFDSIQTTRGLIIDLRQNGGGNSGNGFRILSYFTDKDFRPGTRPPDLQN